MKKLDKAPVVRSFAAACALLIGVGWFGGAAAQAPARPVQAPGRCTAAAPCTGPQGGVYLITPEGTRSYLPRSQAPAVRVQEDCTPARPCAGPQGGRYHISPTGTRHYLPRN